MTKPLLWVLLWTLPTALPAYQLKAQRFVPDQYFIGERVHLILEIEIGPEHLELAGAKDQEIGKPQSAAPLRLSQKEQLPKNLDYQIYQADIFPTGTPDTYTVDITYAVFSTDVGRIAAFRVQGFPLPELTILRARSSLNADNSSVSGQEQQLPAMESKPFSLPWVDLGIALLIQVIVLLPIVLLQGSKRLRKWIRNIRENHRQKRPYRQFLRQLNLLLQKDNLSTQEYFRVLSSQVRYYLSHRTQQPCSAYTTEELAQLNLVILVERQDLWQEILRVLRASDDFRFRTAATSPTALVSNEYKNYEVATVIKFAKLIERQFHKKRQELHYV